MSNDKDELVKHLLDAREKSDEMMKKSMATQSLMLAMFTVLFVGTGYYLYTSISNVEDDVSAISQQVNDQVEKALTGTKNANFDLDSLREEINNVKTKISEASERLDSYDIDKALTKIDAINNLAADIDKSTASRLVEVQSQISNMESKILSLNSKIDSRLNSLKFTKACVARAANNCRPVIPQCPDGWRDSGITEDNTWSGGTCGQGNLCRVCYRFE
ncbi:MAG: hypothetical protein B6D73_13795 [gamma proteobacterium symbiont of Stewartia floridana]|nr:MAG: hypothetical protein B6D73_13795 [gamma proteobacterium symbiont of Stewartia floridana]